MSLFNPDELFEKNLFGSVDSKAQNEFKKISPEDMIDAKFGRLRQDTTIHFVSDGLWSLANLVHYILNNIGPASLIGYTWSFTAPASQKMIHLKTIGLIRDMSFLIDYSMSRWSRIAVAMIKQNSDKVTTTQIHAKGFVIWNDTWNMTCTTSMNFSNNPRIEAGILSTERAVFDFSKKWVRKAIDKGEPFKDDEEDPGVKGALEIKPDDNDYSKIVYVIRGLSGAGKSALAKNIADVVCENNDLFNFNGRYNFEHTRMGDAVATCQAKFKEAISDGIKKIAVANNFEKKEYMDFYVNLARKHGYKVFQMILENANGTQNIHGVKPYIIEKQREKFEVNL